VRSSILKFSFGGHGRLTGPSWLASKVNGITPPPPLPGLNGTGNNKAPLAKNDELGSPSQVELPPSPPGVKNSKEDNIYDTIDEGIPLQFGKKVELASSEESSPTKNKDSSSSSKNGSIEEKIETLSTGSSENGGLLADIISEIKTRNKESIYNSVDRRKMKRKKAEAAAAKAAAEAAAAEKAESSTRARSRSSSPAPYVAPKPPSVSSFSSSTPTSGGSGTGLPSTLSSRLYGSSRPSVNFNLSSTTPKTSPPIIAAKPKLADRPHSTSILSGGIASSLANSIGRRSSYSPKGDSATSSSSSVGTPVNASSVYSSPPANPVAVSASPSLASSLTKPTCAVNGIPKKITPGPGSPPVPPIVKPSPPTAAIVTKSPSPSPAAAPPPVPPHSSPSYVAKINYFSTLGSNSGSNNSTPMKPISSLPAPSSENPAKEIIYAPSTVGVNADGERSHLSTIRRSRPSYITNQDSFGENEVNEKDAGKNSSNNPAVFVKKPGGGGIYASLGRKVAAPVIRSNSIEKEKMEIKREMEKTLINSISTDNGGAGEEDKIIDTEKSAIEKEIEQIGGYKPFNPYLNRPLTFSTFRPGNNASNSNSTVNNNPASNTNNTPPSNGNISLSGQRTMTSNPKPISISSKR